MPSVAQVRSELTNSFLAALIAQPANRAVAQIKAVRLRVAHSTELWVA
jgi:hypothetical protein